jgi:hypothetical protein
VLLLHISGSASGSASGSSAAVLRGGWPCLTPLDCQLNGLCTDGKCVCDSAWKGENCSVLNLLPAKPGQGYGLLGSPTSSWGGSVIHDPKSSKYYMHVAEMVNNCG